MRVPEVQAFFYFWISPGSQNFTHLVFSINLGCFEKRLKTTAIQYAAHEGVTLLCVWYLFFSGLESYHVQY